MANAILLSAFEKNAQSSVDFSFFFGVRTLLSDGQLTLLSAPTQIGEKMTRAGTNPVRVNHARPYGRFSIYGVSATRSRSVNSSVTVIALGVNVNRFDATPMT